MDIFFHSSQLFYAPQQEFTGFKLKPSVENPTRIELLKQALSKSSLDFDLLEPKLIETTNILEEVHDADYIEFLASVPPDWKEGAPHAFAYPHARTIKHNSFKAQLGYYLFDPSTPITPNTFQSARASASSALACVNELSKKNIFLYIFLYRSSILFFRDCYLEKLNVFFKKHFFILDY